MANKIEKQFLDTENKGPVRLNKYLSELSVLRKDGRETVLYVFLTIRYGLLM